MSEDIEKYRIGYGNVLKPILGVIICVTVIFSFSTPLEAFQTGKSQKLMQKDHKQIASRQMRASLKQLNISLEAHETPLLVVLKRLANKARVGISYQNSIIPDKKINVDLENVTVHQALNQILKGTGLKVVLPFSNDVLVIKKKLGH